MNGISNGLVVCFFAALIAVFAGCNKSEKFAALDLLGATEEVLVEKWGPPLQTTGQDFEFYQPYAGGKLLFFELADKEIVVTVSGGKVTSIGLVPGQPDE